MRLRPSCHLLSLLSGFVTSYRFLSVNRETEYKVCIHDIKYNTIQYVVRESPGQSKGHEQLLIPSVQRYLTVP